LALLHQLVQAQPAPTDVPDQASNIAELVDELDLA
jgi:hypothetical protein